MNKGHLLMFLLHILSMMERKEFFKTIASELGDAIANKLDRVYTGISEQSNMPPIQRVFLEEYTLWLTDFQLFVKRRNENPFDMAVQKQLMVLSEQAEMRKPQLEVYMRDKQFYSHFNSLTRDITDAISE